MTIVAPSLLAADFGHLAEEVKAFDKSSAQWLHYDVMDGHFVPNLTFGPDILKIVDRYTDKFIDVHIMVTNPADFLDYASACRIDNLTFHYEACRSLAACRKLIRKIHAAGMKCGISVRPKTPAEVLEPLLGLVDLVLVMSVEPGFGGQKFMADMLEKCDWLAQKRAELGLNYLIEIDGGINGDTGMLARQHHVDVLVAGSYIFRSKDGFEKAVERLSGETNG